MRILVVAATDMEIAPVVTRLRHTSDSGPRVKAYTFGDHDVDVLTTGVGMVATAAWCSHQLALTPYDLGLNFGVCGSFDRALAPGAVVHVVSDRIAELGAEDQDTFLTIQQLNLLGDDEFPFTGGRLVNRTPPSNPTLRSLPAVSRHYRQYRPRPERARLLTSFSDSSRRSRAWKAPRSCTPA